MCKHAHAHTPLTYTFIHTHTFKHPMYLIPPMPSHPHAHTYTHLYFQKIAGEACPGALARLRDFGEQQVGEAGQLGTGAIGEEPRGSFQPRPQADRLL